MVSYRYMFMNMQGMRDGTQDLSTQQVFARGFPVTPTQMTMEMHMLGIFYAPSDWVTLMLMGNYQSIEMDHRTRAGTPPRMMRGETFTTRGEDWGDTRLSALIKFYDQNRARAHFQLGVSAPTGSIDEEDPGTLPYAMQTGSGTWDLIFGPTYLKQYDYWSWGAQAIGMWRLGENDQDYSLGDHYSSTLWAAVPLTDAWSFSGRIGWMYSGAIEGSDSRLNPNVVPTAVPDFYERHRLDAAIGFNFYGQNGFLKGHRFAVEAALPIYEETGGPLLETDFWITAGWQKAF
ncbi:MAG: transporter, partial [Verrucomicrobiota bacterium]